MRRDAQLLGDILDAAATIERSLSGRSREGFVADDDIRDATLYPPIAIVEAVSRLPVAVRQRHPAVPWRAMSGFRNRAVHA